MFPLGIILDYSETMAWQLDYLPNGPGASEDRLQTRMKFYGMIIDAFVQYQVPTIQLIKETPKEAVCQVLEKVNTGGVSLTVFELLTATYAADDFNLRDDWKDRRDKLSAHSVLNRFSETHFLQVVTLLSTLDRREAHLSAHGDAAVAPAVSCKRRDILRLNLQEYRKWADTAVKAVERVVPFLHGEHIFVPAVTSRTPHRSCRWLRSSHASAPRPRASACASCCAGGSGAASSVRCTRLDRDTLRLRRPRRVGMGQGR